MLKSNTPLISVVMPVYNSAGYLSTAIESILNQTHKNFEFIIIDDGSTDASGDIICKYSRQDKRIKLIQNASNFGICETLNRGIRLAKGKYIVRMDADDWSYPTRLEKQLSFMQKHPKIIISGSSIEVCNNVLKKLNRRRYPRTDKEIRKNIFKINPFAHPAVIYRKDEFEKIGGYNSIFSGAEDFDLYFRLGRLGSFANLSETLLKLRTHKDSVSAKFISRQSKINLYIRCKAIGEYGYMAKFSDKFFLLLSMIGILLIPDFLKFRLYNFLRQFQK